MDKHGVFIWDADGEEASAWNLPRAGDPGHQDLLVTVDDEDRSFMTYKGRTVQVPLTNSSDDNAISIHTLSQLVRAESELRFCVDSAHSSDTAFLALAPAEWGQLEAEFGRTAVDYRFLRIPADLDAFFEQAYGDGNDRNYPEEPRELTPVESLILELKELLPRIVEPRCERAAVFHELTWGVNLRVCLAISGESHRVAIKNDTLLVKRLESLIRQKCEKEGVRFLELWFGGL